MRHVNAILLGGVLSVGACTPSEQAPGSPGLDLSVRQVGQCAPETRAEALPGAVAMVDTAALGRALRDLASAEDSVRGYVLLSLTFAEDGVNHRRDILEHDLAPFVADSVQELVFASLRRMPEAERSWGARLRIELEEAISYAVTPREYCPPRPRDPEVESAMHEFIGTGVRYRGGERERVVLLRVRVHPAGYVAGARVIRGAGPGSSLERDLTTFIRQFSFHPAQIDGMPVYGEIDVPVRIGS